jgi:hypothetical protein
VPTPSEENKNFDLFSLHFFQDLLPKHKTDTPAPIRSKDFSRERRLTLPIVLSLIINMIRPGKRFGYQEVLNRFYSDTGLAHQEGSRQKPPDKAAFCRARQKLPLDLFRELFSSAVTKAEEMAAQLGEATWHGFRVLAIDGTKKIMPYSEQLEAFFGIPAGSSFPQMLTCVLYDVLAKIPLDVVYGSFAASERTHGPASVHRSEQERSVADGQGIPKLRDPGRDARPWLSVHGPPAHNRAVHGGSGLSG